MKDKFIKELLKELDHMAVTTAQVKRDVNKGIVEKDARMIPLSRLLGVINNLDRLIEMENKETAPKTKIMYVEDGSVDYDELVESLSNTNPEIKVVLYRQGSRTPEIINLEEE